MTKRKTFTPAFKLEIAKLMVNENYTIKESLNKSPVSRLAEGIPFFKIRHHLTCRFKLLLRFSARFGRISP